VSCQQLCQTRCADEVFGAVNPSSSTCRVAYETDHYQTVPRRKIREKKSNYFHAQLLRVLQPRTTIIFASSSVDGVSTKL
jgi:hypothetical protein